MQIGNIIHLEIAKYRIMLVANDGLELFLNPIYLNFIGSPDQTPHIIINVKKGLPEQNQESIETFKAKIPETCSIDIPQRDWNVIKCNSDFFLSIFSNDDLTKKEAVLRVNNGKHWDIFIHEDLCITNSIDPLQHPIGSLILYYLTAQNGDIFLHSSGVFDGIKGRIFTGFSGAGKSTMAGIWEHNNAKVIHDDRLILRKTKEGWFMHNTPVYLNDTPKSAKINELYLIKHALTNKHNQLIGVHAAGRLLACCIQHDFNKDLIEKLLFSVADLCTSANIFELGFVPDDNIISYLKNIPNS